MGREAPERPRRGSEAVAGEVEALREEQAKAMRHVERRLVRLEAGRSAQDGMERTSPTGAEPEPSKRRHVPSRTYPQLVALEAEPDEDLVYGDATPVIVEWREARAEFLKTLKTGTVLDRTEVQERMLELEIAMIEEHELTLPPASFPLDQFDRRDKLWERRQDLKRVRVERNGGGCAGSSPSDCGGTDAIALLPKSVQSGMAEPSFCFPIDSVSLGAYP